jgi:hypothetical protein
MALVEPHDCNWEASGCARRSLLVCFSYDFTAASKMAWKCEDAAAVDGVWDMTEVARSGDCGGTDQVLDQVLTVDEGGNEGRGCRA